MKARIFDNGIIRNWTNEAPLLYFRKSTNGGSNWSSFSPINYSAVSKDTFSFVIPGSANGTIVQYYFAAQDIALPTPKFATLPAGGSGINPPGTNPPSNRFQYTVGITSVTPVSGEIPVAFKLYDNYPNPFNPVTNINFDIPKNSIVSLDVYDISGKLVETIFKQQLNAGKYQVSYNAGNLSSGVYFYKLKSEYFTDTKKMVLVK
jgi:hypothetical protein